jgi:hypothetical protein
VKCEASKGQPFVKTPVITETAIDPEVQVDKQDLFVARLNSRSRSVNQTDIFLAILSTSITICQVSAIYMLFLTSSL